MKNVQNFYSRLIGSREIQKTLSCFFLLTLHHIPLCGNFCTKRKVDKNRYVCFLTNLVNIYKGQMVRHDFMRLIVLEIITAELKSCFEGFTLIWCQETCSAVFNGLFPACKINFVIDIIWHRLQTFNIINSKILTGSLHKDNWYLQPL